MDDVIKQLLTYGLIPVIVGGASYFMKGILSRIDNLEKELPKKVEENEVRQILIDKVDPIKEDIQEIKQDVLSITNKIDHLIDLFLKKD